VVTINTASPHRRRFRVDLSRQKNRQPRRSRNLRLSTLGGNPGSDPTRMTSSPAIRSDRDTPQHKSRAMITSRDGCAAAIDSRSGTAPTAIRTLTCRAARGLFEPRAATGGGPRTGMMPFAQAALVHGGKSLRARIRRPGLPESERETTWAASRESRDSAGHQPTMSRLPYLLPWVRVLVLDPVHHLDRVG
jgi:hypothetical protein